MAAIDVFVVPGHCGHVQRIPDKRPYAATDTGSFWQPVCMCGWKGPKYPSNDHGTAQTGLDAHCLNANRDEQLVSNFFTDLTFSETRTLSKAPRSLRKPVMWRG